MEILIPVRKTPVVIAALTSLAVALALAACGSSGGGSSKPSATSGAATTAPAGAQAGTSNASLPAVTGVFGTKPSIAKAAGTPPKELQVRALTGGDGPVVATGDTVFVNYLGQLWEGKVFDNSFDRGSAFQFSVGQGGVIQGWDEGVVGQKVGSRLELVIPPDKGYGPKGAGADIPANATLVFVVDVLGAFNGTSSAAGAAIAQDDAALPKVTADPGKKPTIAIPAGGTAPNDLVVKTLIDGTGPAVVKGKTLAAQYVGVIWGSGKEFDASWDRAAAAFPIGVGKVIPGWDEALVGKKIGSRVLLSIPPAKGYGAAGNARAGISGTDTLVFVVDLLGAY
jgi:peptidylprolyl isomerase